ncbi:MAG: flagellar hook-length control protein FliK [Methylobacter sp.]
MKIEGVNLLSLLPGNSTIEEGVRSLLKNGSIPEDFMNALMGQIKLLSKANGQIELPGQLQNMTMSQAINNLHDIGGDLLKRKGGEEELVALFNKYLPLSKKNEDIDLEAALLAVSDALKSIVPSSVPDEWTAAQNMSNVMVLNGLSFAKPLPEEAKLNPPAETNATSGDFLTKAGVLRPSIQNEQDFNLQALKNTEPAEKGLVLKGFSFAKPLPEEAKLNPPAETNATSGDFLAKAGVLRPSIQKAQDFNPQALKNAEPTEKQASVSGTEKAAPGVAADMIPFHRLVDSRTDSQAITRPLTHPDWSKDLGEQLVWMNNKAIPVTEIKLNPAHLGPLSVRIDVDKDQATIMFTAQHAAVKEAIEASIPKLREMLATQQLYLVNVSISQNSTQDQGRPQPQPFSKVPENSEQGTEGITDTLEKTEHNQAIDSKGLLSLYA